MKLEHTGQERISATLAEVWTFINDPEKIAACLPDMQSSTVHDERHVDVVVRVGVGPVRGNFKFKIELRPDQAGDRMEVAISGGGLGSVVDLTAGATLADAGAGITTLDWQGIATMRGPVAAVGGRVLDAQAQKLIAQTFANVKSRAAAAATPA
ncbi:MAG TPA: SRPBCC domain-containing protein [Chloroflexota bacterium]|nr:SRPBCC domain-containing protein [Chloroflexota bacterium]